MQLLTAPVAVAADAVSFAASAALVRTIPVTETFERDERRSMWREAREGMSFVLQDPYLRTIAGGALFLNLFSFMTLALVVLFATRELGVEPAALGVALGVAGAGSLLGAAVAPRLGRAIGIGPAMLAGLVLFAVASALVPLARGPEGVAAAVIAAAFFLRGLGVLQLDVHALSLRQAVTPDRLLGRVNAANRFVVGGMRPAGSLLGGVLGDAIGLRPTLWIGAAGSALVVAALCASPLRGLRRAP